MMPVLAIDWNINPLVFLEFFVVVAFGIGWLILEWVSSRYDRRREQEKSKSQRDPPKDRGPSHQD